MSDRALHSALRAALASVGCERPLRSIVREENVYESSHHSEVIRCGFDRGEDLTLLCKRGPSYDQDRWGLRRGLGYEASVYRHVLGDDGTATPRFYGSVEDAQRRITWLFLEYLGEGWQLDLGPETAIVDAAAALGDLHRHASQQFEIASSSVLNRYDSRYLRRCLQSARGLADRWRARVPAFDEVVELFEAEFERLSSAPLTLVHGECTPHNFVWAHERPYLVDWEEAAIGAGEIDIACLTDEWDEDLVELAVDAYVGARWEGTPPHDFARTLDAARVYWPLRWLANAEGSDEEEEIDWVKERVDAALASPRRP